MAADPEAVARWASWPVSECDLAARHLWLVRQRPELASRMKANPDHFDAKIAGWWVWGISCWIGGGWCSGTGPWTERDGLFVKQDRNGNTLSREPGVDSKRPHLGNNGQGVNRPQLREPGVMDQRPHLGNDGQGVNHAGLREPGVMDQRPHLGNDGQGVNHAGLREPGVSDQRPHLGNNGQGVNHAGLREPGVIDDMDVLTMPKLVEWMEHLARRLRHVRVLCGDWQRAVTGGASKTLPVRQGDGVCGVFFDPPYSAESGRDDGLYLNGGAATNSLTVAHDVRRWCLEHGDDADYRIVLAGFDVEHRDDLLEAGWSEVEWFKEGFLTGGMANSASTPGKTHQQHRERLWLSPHCLRGEVHEQGGLFS